MSVSADYKRQLETLHLVDPLWGTGSERRIEEIRPLVRMVGHRARVLDFGCGKGKLKQALRHSFPELQVDEYDPGIPGKDSYPPWTYSLVLCIDVLEHVEEEELQDTLEVITAKVDNLAYFTIGLQPAKAILPDGRNAHILLRDPDWWLDAIAQYLSILEASVAPSGRRLTLLCGLPK